MSLPALSGFLVDDADEMLDLIDHSAHGWSILQGAATVALVEPETDERLHLTLGTAARAPDLLDRNRLAGFVCLITSFRSAILQPCRRLSLYVSGLCRCCSLDLGCPVATARNDLAVLLAPPRCDALFPQRPDRTAVSKSGSPDRG